MVYVVCNITFLLVISQGSLSYRRCPFPDSTLCIEQIEIIGCLNNLIIQAPEKLKEILHVFI